MTRRSASHDSKRPRSFHRHCRLFDAHNRGGIGRSTATSLGLLLLRNRGLAAKDILLDLASGCFRQLGHKLDSLGTLEVRHNYYPYGYYRRPYYSYSQPYSYYSGNRYSSYNGRRAYHRHHHHRYHYRY